MKTKIFILLTVLLSLSVIQELRSQDTLWSKIIGGNISAKFTKDGTKVLYTFGSGENMQLCTADSGRVLWSKDTTHLVGKFFTPDSLYFFSEGGQDSSNFLVMLRLSDGSEIKRYDTLILNNYPQPVPYYWLLGTCTFSNNGRYLFIATSDWNNFTPWDATTHNIIYKIDLITNQLVYLRRDSTIDNFEMKPDENVIICENRHGISFYDTDSLKEQKSYKDWGIGEISRSGRYITTIHSDSLFTWDTQRDSII